MAAPAGGGVPRVRGEVNSFCFDNELTASAVHAILNSSTYYLFFCVYTDTRHINPGDVAGFPLDLSGFPERVISELADLSGKLSECCSRNTSRWNKSGLLIDSVDSKPCKTILDSIDLLLGQAYGFSDEEVAAIINYDIKYRMGGADDEA